MVIQFHRLDYLIGCNLWLHFKRTAKVCVLQTYTLSRCPLIVNFTNLAKSLDLLTLTFYVPICPLYSRDVPKLTRCPNCDTVTHNVPWMDKMSQLKHMLSPTYVVPYICCPLHICCPQTGRDVPTVTHIVPSIDEMSQLKHIFSPR